MLAGLTLQSTGSVIVVMIRMKVAVATEQQTQERQVDGHLLMWSCLTSSWTRTDYSGQRSRLVSSQTVEAIIQVALSGLPLEL